MVIPPPSPEQQDWIAGISAFLLGCLMYYLTTFIANAYLPKKGKKP